MKTILSLLLMINLSFNLLAQKESTLEKAEDAYLMLEYEKAKDLYTTLLIEGEEAWNYYIYYRRAYCYYSLKKYDLAIKDARRALRIKRGHNDYVEIKGRSFWLIASIYSQEGKHEKAVEYLEYASKISNDSYTWNNIGYSQLKLEEYEQALESFNKALELNIENAYSLSNRSFVYLRLGQIEAAKADLKKAFELDPNNPYVYKYEGLLYIELEEIDKACVSFRRAKEMGYETFRKRVQDQEVNNLIKQYCQESKE